MAEETPERTKGIMPDQDEKHRAGAGEGFRAPFIEEGGAAQHSIYDGKGNEVVVVTSTNDDGVLKQGTGANAEEATEDSHDTKEPIGEGFFPHPKLLGK